VVTGFLSHIMQQQIRFCTTQDGARIAYAVSGSGPPLVKAANWLSHLEFDWNSPVWRHWVTELSRYNTLVRYDQRGCGLSDWDVDILSFDAQVQDLKTVVDTLNLDRFALLGLSHGTAVAIAFAERFPEKVSHLVLFGGYARGRYYRTDNPQQVKSAEILLGLIRHGWGQENAAFRQVYTTLFIPGGTPEQILWFNDLQRLTTSPEIAERLQTVSFSTNVVDKASRLKVPTLVLHALQDAVVPFSEGRLIASLIPGARFVPLEGQNHVMLEDEPAWGRFLAEVRSFLGVGADAPDQPPSMQPVFPELTSREREVLELIAQGLDNAEIAERLVVSQKTVRNHTTHIFQKLMVRNRAQAIVLSRQAGMGH
jgi:pimeloyl-ACP methyl ester carboxylesterase/DNA-binding CsgD family transcriptional regulator